MESSKPTARKRSFQSEQRLALEMADLRRDLELALRASLMVRGVKLSSTRASRRLQKRSWRSSTRPADNTRKRPTASSPRRMPVSKSFSSVWTTYLLSSPRPNNELSELRAKDENATRVLNEQKTTLDAEIALGSRTTPDRYSEEKKLYQEDLKAQAEIAQQAQQSYEDELLKHAEAARSLQGVRKEYNELRTDRLPTIKAESEASKASLERA